MRILSYLFFAALFLAPHSAASQIRNEDVAKAEAYLSGLDTAKADFIQRASTGSILTGIFYLDRPGKLRFEYNEVKDFIVADGLLIYFYDSEMGEQTNAPIGQTLADFLLRKNLKLENDITVSEAFRKDGYSFITIVQTDDPAAGSVQLTFSEVPYALRKWRVTDAQGEITEIELKNMERDMDLPGNLFAYFDPKGRKPVNE